MINLKSFIIENLFETPKIGLVFCCLFLALAGSGPLKADPVLPHLFSDHMVLQCDAPIRVWGTADPGERLTVILGGETSTTVADRSGQWKVSLAPMHGGGPFALRIDGKTTVIYKDVLIGEVWVASGQSNMTYALSGAADAGREIARANYPRIRFFTVPERIALGPQQDTLDAKWEQCTPDTAKEFSAVAYYFAKKIHESLGVPVGIIHSSWPGTAAEDWTDPESLRREPELRPIVERWEASPQDVKSYAATPAEFALEFDDFELIHAENVLGAPRMISDFDSGAATTETGGNWTYSWKDGRGTAFELVAQGRGGKGYAARVSGKMDGATSSRLEANFAADGAPVDLSSFDGLRFWVRGNGLVQFQMLQPSISDWDNYSAPGIRATPEWKEATIWFRDLKQEGWGVVMPLTLNAVTGFVLVNSARIGYPDRPPSGLYEAMITPLLRYGIRGALWYQGESNTWRAHQYRTLLPSLIAGWRKGWDEGNFPFLIVQLPNLGTTPEFGDSIWAELREAQLLTAKTAPNTGLAVTIDVGDEKNLHPPRKAEVGDRLALWALGTTYGQTIVYSGPLYDSMNVEGNQIRVRFKNVGSGLEARGGELKGFAIAGADKKFHWADAQISGDTVVVSSRDVPAPVTVRYAWAGSPNCNLYNKEGLPASPFRTDDWPGASDANR